MRPIQAAAIAAVILFALPVASVYGAGYAVSVPILGTTGAPALGAPGYFSGVMTVLYADGTPVVLGYNRVTLKVCGTSCVTITATLKQTAPGAYSYTFTPPSTLTGTDTIYIVAGSLADDNGRIFPSVDTQIGAYAAPSSSTTSTPPPQTSATTNPNQAITGAPQSPESTQLTKQAVSTSAPKQQSPIMPILLVLSALAVVGVGLLVYPGRRT